MQSAAQIAGIDVDSFEDEALQHEIIEKVERLAHRVAFRRLTGEIDRLPSSIQSAERLSMAASLIEDAAYALAQELPTKDVFALLCIAADLDREIKRLVSL